MISSPNPACRVFQNSNYYGINLRDEGDGYEFIHFAADIIAKPRSLANFSPR